MQELFSKLRFSYLEQVTKEKFLRAIVGDPPVVVGHHENVELEAQLAEVKRTLKSRKEEARVMIEEMEKMGRNLAAREFMLYNYGLPETVCESTSEQSHGSKGTGGCIFFY